MKRAFSTFVQRAKETLADFSQDEALTLAAALAFYAGLSFAPLVLIGVSIAGLLGEEAVQEMVAQVQGLLGPEAGRAVTLVVESAADRKGSGWLAATFGIAALLFSATGAFIQLQASLNRIWEVRAKPGLGIKGWIRRRLLSMGMVLAVVFLLMVSLAVSAAVSLLFGDHDGCLWEALDAVVSLVAFGGLFALLFKYVPDVHIPWRVVRIGAGLTAVLFLLGKTAIGLYLGRSAVGSAYGAAGGLVLLLLWVYYCAIVLFLGAEATQTEARVAGVRIVPREYAVAIAEDRTSEKDAEGRMR